MRHSRRHFLPGAIFFFCMAVVAAGPARATGSASQGDVARIDDANTFRLGSGDRVRLADIQAPRRGYGRPGMKDWPLALEARAFVDRLIRGKTVQISDSRRDRYGRIVGTVRLGAGPSLQRRLLEAGLARVYSVPGRTRRVAALLEVEKRARAARKGIWGHAFYAVRDHNAARNDIGSYQLVTGAVQRVAMTRRMIYLNFGWNWREDFTVAISRRDAKAFETAGVDIAAYEGRRIRVRGWIERNNGPMIRARGPGQIELLNAD